MITLAAAVLSSCDKDKIKGNDPDGQNPDIYDRMVFNPYLASDLYSITHFNSAQTDAFPYAVKTGNWEVDP